MFPDYKYAEGEFRSVYSLVSSSSSASSNEEGKVGGLLLWEIGFTVFNGAYVFSDPLLVNLPGFTQESFPSIKNILLLDLEGKRVAVKYYSDDWSTLNAKLAFEKSVFAKTQKTSARTEERATTTMEEIPNSAPNETLIKAEAPKLVSLLKEMKNRLDVLNITFI
ncbi:Coatomer subunit zeta-3 [Acorus calamus]|uniref:Coatomer subunit zeta n=1 Tax=Acorus calamus TaxID=4465 RepID=A0AAV9F6H0_ACOCL|nr:Coatomer subunit zeta-3 [Acorus calamus]